MKKEYIYVHIYIHTHTHTHICITESLCHTPETNMTLLQHCKLIIRQYFKILWINLYSTKLRIRVGSQ